MFNCWLVKTPSSKGITVYMKKNLLVIFHQFRRKCIKYVYIFSTSMVCRKTFVYSYCPFSMYIVYHFFQEILEYGICLILVYLDVCHLFLRKFTLSQHLKVYVKLQTYFWYLHNYNFSGEKQMVWPLWQEERVHCVLLKVLPPV